MSTPFVGPSAVRDLDDDDWLALLCKSLDQPEVDGMRFPSFPPEEIQRNFVGDSGEGALRDAVRFVRYALDALAASGVAPGPESSAVDFGCGWGRITRALLRAFEPARILGVDPLESMVADCRRWFAPSPVRFETTGTWPPLPSPPGTVDLVVAFSVFSHLPESLATSWMAEFLRVLKPGGLVVATTQSRSFIALCEQMRTDPAYQDSDFVWYQLLARSFVDADDARRRFDAGEFLHEPNGGGEALDGATYGDSLFGPAFVEQRWAPFFEPFRFDDKPYGLPQACFVLRKRAPDDQAVSGQQLQALTDRVAALEGELDAVRASRTWRAGRAVLTPVRLARRWRQPPDPGPASAPVREEPEVLELESGDGGFAPSEHPGYCPACDQETVFDIVQAWLRDGYLCRRCGSIPRERALALVLRRLRPDFAGLIVHESSPEWRGISAYLRDRCPGYVATYCRPGQPLGVDVDGYRNEDLEQLSFADGSIDLHITQDVMEHVFDLDAANREIERTLAPGGLHIFTTPMVNGAQPTFQRARRDPTGEIVYLAPPTYHGNPIDAGGSLVTFDFGFDLPIRIDRATELTTTVYAVDNVEMGIRGEYLEVCVSAKDGTAAAAIAE